MIKRKPMCQNPGVPVAEKVEVWLVVITIEGEEILVGKAIGKRATEE